MQPYLVTDGKGIAVLVWSDAEALKEVALILADQLHCEGIQLAVAVEIAMSGACAPLC